MRLFNRVVIIGVGLIGGSIGLAIKKKGVASKVIGISRHKKTLDLAKARGAIDFGFQEINAVKDADLIILATPVRSIIEIGLKIAFLIKPNTLITDTGSTKKLIVEKLEKVLPNFVGAHPLSGSEKQGARYANGDLFRGSLCILTPTTNTHGQALERISRFWKALGARVVNLTPSQHDKFIAYVSHLPHLIAFSLIRSIPKSHLCFASFGLKDTTRIASSDASLWRDIFLTNQKELLKTVKSFQVSLSKIKSAIVQKDSHTLKRLLNQAKKKRDSIL